MSSTPDTVITARPWFVRAYLWLAGPAGVPRHYRLTRWLFLRLLGFTSLCAFLSLHTQLDGLYGEQGMAPVSLTMAQAADHAAGMERAHAQGNPDGWAAPDRYLYFPTLFWLGASDTWLFALLLIGVLLSLLLIADIAPGPVLLGLWLIYLSFVTAGDIFLQYQWDALLLETLFVAMFFAPWRRVLPALGRDLAPSRIGLWLLRLLLFKLMFMSGVVKLLAHDQTWNNLTALGYHYFTQPIPGPISYYAHHLPGWVHSACTFVMFVIELVLPFFIFGPRRLRLMAWPGFVLLMLLIGLTGNYGFFNLLTIVLCTVLLDDIALTRLVPRRLRSRVPDLQDAPRRPGPRVRAVLVACAIPIVLLSGLRMSARFDRGRDRAAWSEWLLMRTGSFQTINAYGLFASMTTRRPEIVLEGSRDGVTWDVFEFRYKPGSPDRRPGFAGLHMPRLDWQMWFAALGHCSHVPWFHAFMLRLLQGAPPVRALLANDPFADAPPVYIRSTLYQYTFTEPGSAGWWQRERVGPFCPTVTLQNGRLMRAPNAR